MKYKIFSPMKGEIPIIIASILIVLVATILVILLLINCKKNQLSQDQVSNRNNPILELIKVADSIRDSSPDSALRCYNKAILTIKTSPKINGRMQLLASAYIGIANINSNHGEYIIALKNDSIAMDILTQCNDKKLESRAYLVKGRTLCWLGEYDKAKACYQQALNLANEIKDYELQAKIFSGRAIVYAYQGDYQKTIEGFTQALNIGKQLKNDQLIAGNYMNLALIYNNMGVNDSVLSYYNLALTLYKKLNDKNGELLCYNNMGSLYYSLADFGKAIEYYQVSVKLALEMNDKYNEAKGNHNLAEVYKHLGDNATAIDLEFKSLKIKEQLNDKLSLAKGFIGLGELYYNQKNYPTAKIYFEKALKNCLEINCIPEIGSCYSNVASVYSAENNNTQAIVYYNKALEYQKKTGNTYGISNLYINLGSEYAKMKEYKLSEKYLLKAKMAKRELKDEEGIATVNHQLANLYDGLASRETGDLRANVYRKAEKAGLESYRAAKRISTIPIMRDASNILKIIYQKQGKYSEAVKYADIFIALNDSLLNKNKIQALIFAEARWNVEKKQHEINNLENTHKLQQEIIISKEAQTQNQKIIIWIIVALFLVSAVATLIFTLYFRKRRDVIYQKQLADIAALRMQNVRNTMSPHFFFNVLASLSGLSDQPDQMKEKINSLSLLLRKMIENIDRSAIPLDEELAAVKAYIDLFQVKLAEPISVEYQIQEGTDMHSLIPAMMIQIPVENAIKHGLMPLEGEKKLTIRIADSDKSKNIAISDNGIGLKASAGRSTGTGTGLKILLQTIQLLNSGNQQKIKFSIFERDPGNTISAGTCANIEIPLEFSYSR
ncbi:MAG: tetratricopeptide repeat protein [Bacteroidales bacterium]|nr:tetratricopeptide repeat protein [Bacteroidales bacterium]